MKPLNVVLPEFHMCMHQLSNPRYHSVIVLFTPLGTTNMALSFITNVSTNDQNTLIATNASNLQQNIISNDEKSIFTQQIVIFRSIDNNIRSF